MSAFSVRGSGGRREEFADCKLVELGWWVFVCGRLRGWGLGVAGHVRREGGENV